MGPFYLFILFPDNLMDLIAESVKTSIYNSQKIFLFSLKLYLRENQNSLTYPFPKFSEKI